MERFCLEEDVLGSKSSLKKLQEFVQKKKSFIVFLSGDGCKPCDALAPQLEKMADEAGIIMIKAKREKEPEFFEALGITGVPTTMFFIGGTEIDTVVGTAMSKIKKNISLLEKEG